MKSSIMLAAMIKASLGNAVADGAALQLSPMAFAGWLGLMVTALNLLPIGQLDGGHITRAMFGTRTGNIISMVSMGLLFLAAVTVAPGLMMWAFVVYFMAGRGIPPLNDVSKIGKGRLFLGLLALIILALIVIPMPEGKSAADGLTRSYL
jgi:membrane-associated protease RseP (regulator of RpoE activity)